jgi:DNA-binding LacI/PurR family transcriptional regulator
MSQKPIVTLQTIADRAGVSRGTVSNVLHRNLVGERADARRNARRITEIAAELGYRPNTAARAIQTRLFNAIGLLASTDPRVSSYQPYLGGLTAACREHDMNLTIGEVEDEQLTSREKIPRLLREWMVDGLLICYMWGFPSVFQHIIDQSNVPSVWVNAKRSHDCVRPDDATAGPVALEYLTGLGHSRIGYATGSFDDTRHYSLKDRREGYIAAMQQAGLTSNELTWPREESNSQINQRIVAWLSGPDRPTAVFAQSADDARLIYSSAMYLGLRVPGDLSLLTIMDQLSGSLGHKIDTVRLPVHDVGRRAVELLRQKVRQPAQRLPAEALPMTLDLPRRLGRTSAPPGQA